MRYRKGFFIGFFFGAVICLAFLHSLSVTRVDEGIVALIRGTFAYLFLMSASVVEQLRINNDYLGIILLYLFPTIISAVAGGLIGVMINKAHELYASNKGRAS